MRFLTRTSVLLPPVAAAAVLATGCAAFSDDPADDGRTRVAAAFYPLAYVAERVAGDLAEVDLLTAPGGEPHDLELSVQQTGEITTADVVVFAHGFQPAVDEAVEQNAEGEQVDAAEVVDLLAAEESESEHEEHAGEEHAEDEHGHDHGEEDPHFWHDPLRVADLADAVAEALAEVDPDHATDFEDNAAALRSELEELDQEFTTGLASCERDTVVVSHDAFGYLEKYGLHLEPITGLSPDAEPSPAHLAELQDLVREEGITTVFSERLAAPELAETLAADVGVETAVLDPVEGLTDETEDEDYLSLMQDNLAALRTANGCR